MYSQKLDKTCKRFQEANHFWIWQVRLGAIFQVLNAYVVSILTLPRLAAGEQRDWLISARNWQGRQVNWPALKYVITDVLSITADNGYVKFHVTAQHLNTQREREWSYTH